MTGQTKALLIGAILIGGLLLSLPFRHSADKRSTLNSTTQDEVWLKKTSWKSNAGEETEPKIEAKKIEPKQNVLAPINPLENLDPIQTPPDHRPIASLQQTLTKIPDNVVAIKKPGTNNVPAAVNSVTKQTSPALNIPKKQPASNTQFIKHVVRDGDTLQSLAKRYLGDSRLAFEIFNTNRGKLKNPKMLPVNDELLIEVKR